MKPVSSDVNFVSMEEKVLSFWDDKKIFEKSNDNRNKADIKKEFNFYDGPPFANGLPHYGHMLGQVLKDVVPRYWNMRGYYVERRFGWDCHGLPVEFEVEKKYKLNGRKDVLAMGVDKFNETCRSTVFHYSNEWKHTIKRLGRWVDWNNQYRTMDRSFMESVWWAFSKLFEKGLVYKDLKVVAYSPRISAVVSNFEANLNYKDVQDPALTVKFKLKDEENTYFLAWTTTPWTLISNLALASKASLDYVKIKDKASNENYWLCEERLAAVYKDPSMYEIVSRCKGSDLVGKEYEPLFSYFKDNPNSFKMLNDDYVTTDAGTGIVHLAPYGEDDFRLCKKNSIPTVDPMDAECKFSDEIVEFAGEYIKDADKNIIKLLKEQGKIFKHETIVHSYPHCDRTEAPLIYRPIPTWYVAVEKFKDRLVELNKTIRWVPSHLRDGRMGRWLENARDWAISRNRFWGTPIPIWVCQADNSHLHAVGSVAELEKLSGRKIEDLHKHFIDDIEFDCPICGSKMQRISEVFDCWFESGSMPYAQNHYPFENKEKFLRVFPADFIAEGQDQTRGWFYTLIVLAGALFDSPPFKNVIVNGIVLAKDGKKMSKRLRNYTPPDELLDKYGADSVRLYMLNSPVLRGDDLKFSDEGVKDTARLVLLPLWNAFSFLTTYADVDNWQPDVELLSHPLKSDNDLDNWIISKLQSLKKEVHTQMEQYQVSLVVPILVDFIDNLTNWYIRLSRRRFWSGSSEGISKDTLSAYSTLYHVLVEFTKILAPFAPFISERIYQHLTEGLSGAKESVHLEDMPYQVEELIDKDLEKRMLLTRLAVNLGRSLRAKHQIKTRQVLQSMTILVGSPEDKLRLEQSSEIIKEELNIKNIIYSTDETSYVNLSFKPNLKILGKVLGKKISELKSILENMDYTQTAQVVKNLDEGKSVCFLERNFSKEEFLIERSSKDQQPIASESGVTVLLDTTLNEELIREGLSREVVNRVQNLRKEFNLHVSNRIDLAIVCDNKLEQALKENKEYVCQEVLALGFNLYNSNSSEKIESYSYKSDVDIEGSSCKIAFNITKG